jgi:CrcB protein
VTLLFVVLGAVVGAPLRYLTDRFVQGRHSSRLPWGTFTVNVAGSFILGALAASPVDGALAALVGIGFCGALTTYSTFSFETVRLVEDGAYGHAFVNVIGSIGAGLVAAVGGAVLITALT